MDINWSSIDDRSKMPLHVKLEALMRKMMFRFIDDKTRDSMNIPSVPRNYDLPSSEPQIRTPRNANKEPVQSSANTLRSRKSIMIA